MDDDFNIAFSMVKVLVINWLFLARPQRYTGLYLNLLLRNDAKQKETVSLLRQSRVYWVLFREASFCLFFLIAKYANVCHIFTLLKSNLELRILFGLTNTAF
jgi:hypothetical protein